jgi:hypothetical protein
VVAVVERDEARGTLTEALEVKAYADAAGWVYETAAEAPTGITLATIREVHRRVVGPVWATFPPATRHAGAFRTTGVTVGGGRLVQLSPAPAVHADTTDWAAVSGELSDAHPIQQIAEQHAWFERIHPFTDENGRVDGYWPTGNSSKPTIPRWLSGFNNGNVICGLWSVPISGTPAAWWSCSPEQSANRSTGSFCLGSPVTLGSFLSECWQRTARTHRITSVSLLSPVGFAPAARITVAQLTCSAPGVQGQP